MFRTQLGNPDLKWETNVTANLGVDFGFFTNRITGSVDVFDRTSRDPPASGESALHQWVQFDLTQCGLRAESGLEVELNTVNIQSGDFKWRTSFNITTIQNKVTKLIDGITPLQNPDSAITISYTDYYNVTRTAILGVHYCELYDGIRRR